MKGPRWTTTITCPFEGAASGNIKNPATRDKVKKFSIQCEIQ